MEKSLIVLTLISTIIVCKCNQESYDLYTVNSVISLGSNMTNATTFSIRYGGVTANSDGYGIGSRKRRDLASQLANVEYYFKLEYGSDTKVSLIKCTHKGTTVQSTTVCTKKMCSECKYRVQLSKRYWPRIHFHSTCFTEIHSNPEDYSCLYGEGKCMENIATVTIKYDANQEGRSKLNKWTNKRIDLATSCSCQVLCGSMFEDYV